MAADASSALQKTSRARGGQWTVYAGTVCDVTESLIIDSSGDGENAIFVWKIIRLDALLCVLTLTWRGLS